VTQLVTQPLTESKSSWACIDADIHPYIAGGMSSVVPYLPESWRRRFETVKLPASSVDSPVGVNRADARGPAGEPAASSPALIAADYLDPNEVIAAVMLSLEAARASYLPSPADASMLVSAYNDYFAAEWLGAEPRLRLAITIAPRDPNRAAAEIQRWAPDPRVAAVYMPSINILIGESHYYPIYAAAEEAGLPIVLHPGMGEGHFQGAPTFAGGIPTTYAERHTMLPQMAQSSVISLVYEGVFERFEKVKFVFAEFGTAWIPAVLWRMDKNWRGLRPSLPWVKKSPIDYVCERIRFTSQPMEEPPDPAFLDSLLSMMYAEKTLMFSSDYPHWDNDYPRRTLGALSPELRRRILFENGSETLRLAS
jgi:predicted TIM-barrel fold metal-dependent hydrolase